MAIHTRHVHVADDQTKGLLLQCDECGFAAVDGSMCIAAQFERDTQCFSQGWIIFDQQYFRSHQLTRPSER